MANAVVLGILVVAVGSAVFYMIRAKKRGSHCIGCSCGGCCSSRKEGGCSCHSAEEE